MNSFDAPVLILLQSVFKSLRTPPSLGTFPLVGGGQFGSSTVSSILYRIVI